MKLKLLKGVMLASLLAFIGLAPLKSNADVIELSLVVDASTSIVNADYALQVGAYGSIFGSGSFFDTYLNPGDVLWANFIVFSSTALEVVPFTSITDNASATAFGNAVVGGASDRVALGFFAADNFTTSTGLATDTAVASIQNNGVSGDRQVIDISTDGVPTIPPPDADAGAPSPEVRAEAITAASNANAAGITVNAIGVGGVDTTFLDDFTTAGGGFFLTATDFSAFQGVLEEKLETELAPPPPPPPPSVPEPGMLGLFGIGLLGLGLARRRRVVA